MIRDNGNLESKNLELCYEAIFPGLGRRSYILIMIYFFILSMSLFTYVYKRSINYSNYISLIGGIFYLLNIYLFYKKNSYVLDIKKDKIFLAIIAPGLDLIVSKRKISGTFIIILSIFLSSLSNIIYLLFQTLYLIMIGKIYKFDRLFKIYLTFTLILYIPISYIEEIKYQRIYIASESMEPTLKVGKEYIMVKTKDVKVGDIGVFYPNDSFSSTFVKRIVAKEGDTIYLEGETLYVNENPIENIKYGEKGNLKEKSTIVIEKNMLYLLGDNTLKSYDSRDFGSINIKSLKGRVIK